MADHRSASGAARPILARHVGVAGNGTALRAGTGQNVVRVRRVAATVDDRSLFSERGLLGQIVSRRVQIIDTLGDDDALGVGPRAGANPVAGVDGLRTLGAQVSAPGFLTSARRLCQCLAMIVGTGQTAEIAAFAWPCAGYEKRHRRLLRQGNSAGCSEEG